MPYTCRNGLRHQRKAATPVVGTQLPTVIREWTFWLLALGPSLSLTKTKCLGIVDTVTGLAKAAWSLKSLQHSKGYRVN